jgi:hypothetical protein
MQQNIKPRLRRAEAAFTAVMQQNLMSPQLKSWLQQQLASPAALPAASGQLHTAWTVPTTPLLPAPSAASVPNPQQLFSAAAAQSTGQTGTTEQAMPYTVTTPGTETNNSGSANPLSFGQLDLSYPSQSGFGSGFGYFQGAAAQLAEPSSLVLTAAAATRSKSNAVKLSNPAQLHGFMPTSAVAADPNTSAGGRPEPLPAEAAVTHSPTPAIKALADMLTQAVFQWAERQAAANAASSANVAAAVADNFIVGVPVAPGAADQIPCSSSSGAAAADPYASLRPTRILFTPEPWVPEQHMGRIRVLHRIRPELQSRPSNLSLQLAASGRKIPISSGAYDDGAMPSFMPVAVAEQLGISWRTVDSIPALQMADGEFKSSFVGRTEPLTLILGEGTAMPLKVFFPEGIWLTKGDAGVMYQICFWLHKCCMYLHDACRVLHELCGK